MPNSRSGEGASGRTASLILPKHSSSSADPGAPPARPTIVPAAIRPKVGPAGPAAAVSSPDGGSAAAAEFLERKKNEIVREMLLKVKSFVGANGALRSDVSVDELAVVM